MNSEQTKIYEGDYLPFIIKWGKRTMWVALVATYIPVLALIVFYGAAPSLNSVISACIAVFSAYFIWCIVDPVTLYPFLQIPGMYVAYLSGNTKEIRFPAIASGLSAAGVDAGTPEGTLISCLGITTSVFVSVTVLTLVAVAGDLILRTLPAPVVRSLNYLLPAILTALTVERVMQDYKTSIILLPIAIVFRYMNTRRMFASWPFGGTYAQLVLIVIAALFISKKIGEQKLKKQAAQSQ
jgi:hypothetical protein